jgi:uncharacterized membrane protein YccC
MKVTLRRWLREGRGWQGAQLAAATVLSFLASGALGLPQGFWAVMSSLIVMRANPDATLDAGLDRIFGTLAGALAGVAGVALYGDRGHAPGASLAIVAVLSFLTAMRPALRAAPIAALIVMAAPGSASQGPLHAALLRTAEIATGIATSLAVAWLASKFGATARPGTACAHLLRLLEKQLDAPPETREEHSRAARAAARRVGELVQGSRAERERQMLQLALRLSQDVGLLVRLRAEADASSMQAAGAALLACARRLEGIDDDADRDALHALSNSALGASPVDPLALLREDLHKLLRVSHATAKAAAAA